MIYRFNDIFLQNTPESRIISRHIVGMNMVVPLSDTTTGELCPKLSVILKSIYMSSSALTLTIESTYTGSRVGEQSHKTVFNVADIVAGERNIVSSNGVSVYYIPPDNVISYEDLNLIISPHIVTVNQTPKDTSVVELNAEDIDVNVSPGIVTLSLAQPVDDGDILDTTGAVKFVNGISPGESGNIDITAMSNGITIAVSELPEDDDDQQ